MTADQAIVLAVRIGLCLLFLPFLRARQAAQLHRRGRAGGETFSWKPLAVLAIVAGLGIEIFMSLGIVTGTADRSARW